MSKTTAINSLLRNLEPLRADIERINALALLQGGELMDSFIKGQNAIIDKYANLVAQRKGMAKKDGNSQ